MFSSQRRRNYGSEVLEVVLKDGVCVLACLVASALNTLRQSGRPTAEDADFADLHFK